MNQIKPTLIICLCILFFIILASKIRCQELPRQDLVAHMVACNTISEGCGLWPAIGVGVGIEVWDHTKNNGKFSMADMIANVLGAYVGSKEWDEYVQFKFSFRNFTEYVNSESFDYIYRLSPHYDYMIYWIVLKGKHLIDKPFNFINFAVGVTTNGYADEDKPYKREIKVALDIDISSIFPDIPKVFNCFHIGIMLN